MTSKKRIKPYNPFGDAKFDDSRISELNALYCAGKISAEEYMDKLLNK